MIASNPLLGPEWEPLAHVLWRLFEGAQRGKPFGMQTYARRFQCSPYASPFVQTCSGDDGSLIVELSGNLQVEPKLSDAEYDTLEFYGWSRPECTPEEYREGAGGDSPNFSRLYEPGADPLEIAEFVLTSLVGVFSLTVDDFFGFESREHAEKVASMRKLGRIKIGDTNPDGVIFAMPGKHGDILEPTDSMSMCVLKGPPKPHPEV